MLPIFEFEALPAIQGFVSSARETRIDLSDLLIGHSARLSGCECVVTFDKRAARSELFEILR